MTAVVVAMHGRIAERRVARRASAWRALFISATSASAHVRALDRLAELVAGLGQRAGSPSDAKTVTV